MDIKEKIQKDITDNKVMIYMKGSPSFPQCGFTKTVIDIMANFDTEFGYANVLEDAELRQGIKDFSDWPTIPQVFVDGEFIGGCDIVIEMYQNGDLQKLLGASSAE